MGSYNSVSDLLLEIRRDNIVGQKIVNVLGHKYNLGTSEVVISELDNGDDIDQSAIFATPTTIKVSSTSVNDKAAGTGMRTVTIYGLDTDGNEQNEPITLNGKQK